MTIQGTNVYGLLSAERGVHRLVRISPFDAQKRRHTSFASLDVIPLLEGRDEEEVEIDPKDLRIDVYRSSGPGGQSGQHHRLRRPHHPPPDRHRGRLPERAIPAPNGGGDADPEGRLAERQRLEQAEELETLRGERRGIDFGSQIRSCNARAYRMVKDHRTDVEIGDPDRVLDGDLDRFIEAELRRRVGMAAESAAIAVVVPGRRWCELGSWDARRGVPSRHGDHRGGGPSQGLPPPSWGPTTAVAGLDLAVPEGGVFGFLGPNGAGKTTTIRCLLGLVQPSGGRMRLLGADVPRRLADVIGGVGSIVETPTLYPRFTARRNLELLARLAGPGGAVGEILERVGLGGREDELVRGYSLGMKQRLGIGAALLKDPRLLILDEPANGLDPAGIVGARPDPRPRSRGANGLRLEPPAVRGPADLRRRGDPLRGRLVTQGPVGEVLRAGHAEGLIARLMDLDGDLRARRPRASAPRARATTSAWSSRRPRRSA